MAFLNMLGVIEVGSLLQVSMLQMNVNHIQAYLVFAGWTELKKTCIFPKVMQF